MKPEDEFKFLDERVRKSPGHQVQVSIDYLKESKFVLDGNTRELQDELRGLRERFDKLVDESDASEVSVGRAQISELNRRLQNYVGARMSLRDHTYAELKRLELWKDTDWHRDVYKPKADKLLVKDKFLFLQDLRNYVAHNRIIPIYAGIAGDDTGEISQHISLDVERLKKSSRWTAPAKRFLDSQDKKIDISQLVDDYRSAADEFYRWLPRALCDAKQEELKATDKIWKERQRLRKRIDDRRGQTT